MGWLGGPWGPCRLYFLLFELFGLLLLQLRDLLLLDLLLLLYLAGLVPGYRGCGEGHAVETVYAGEGGNRGGCSNGLAWGWGHGRSEIVGSQLDTVSALPQCGTQETSLVNKFEE